MALLLFGSQIARTENLRPRPSGLCDLAHSGRRLRPQSSNQRPNRSGRELVALGSKLPSGRPLFRSHVVGVYTLDSSCLSCTHSSRHFAPVAYELSWLNFDACSLRLG